MYPATVWILFAVNVTVWNISNVTILGFTSSIKKTLEHTIEDWKQENCQLYVQL